MATTETDPCVTLAVHDLGLTAANHAAKLLTGAGPGTVEVREVAGELVATFTITGGRFAGITASVALGRGNWRRVAAAVKAVGAID